MTPRRDPAETTWYCDDSSLKYFKELSALFDLEERFSVLPNDLETIESFIEANARASRSN